MSSGGGRCRIETDRNSAVLVVEDEVITRMAAADFLISAGYSVIEAADAAQAISVLESGREIDLVLTDIRMPGSLDGLGLMEWIRERFPFVAVILSSAIVPSRDVPGDAVFIEKPYLPQTVLLAIESLIEQGARSSRRE
jgi:CheY-like chemotaxis protein